MVSLAFVLLTVSTLATCSNALPTEQTIVPHECEGSTLCDIKPADYPQEEIDRLVLEQLPHLQRMKREAPLPSSLEPDSITRRGNCAVIRRTTTAYTAVNNEGLPEIIVQSKWFNQTIPEVICKYDSTEEGACFASHINGITNIRTKCETKFLDVSLTVYSAKKNKTVPSIVQIGVDCACVVY